MSFNRILDAAAVKYIFECLGAFCSSILYNTVTGFTSTGEKTQIKWF